jgi:hypothetical protein
MTILYKQPNTLGSMAPVGLNFRETAPKTPHSKKGSFEFAVGQAA